MTVPTATSLSSSHGHRENTWRRIGRGSLLIATLNEGEMLMSWSRQRGQVAGAVLEARALSQERTHGGATAHLCRQYCPDPLVAIDGARHAQCGNGGPRYSRH